MSKITEDKAAHSLRKRGSMSSISSHEFRRKDIHGRNKEWVTQSVKISIQLWNKQVDGIYQESKKFPWGHNREQIGNDKVQIIFRDQIKKSQ